MDPHSGVSSAYTHGMEHTDGMAAVKSRRSQHTADSRMALIKAARRLFGERGYAAVSLDEVCRRARLTKGALYHHFENKEDLFLAVYDQVEADLVSAGAEATDGAADLWAQLSGAGRALLDICVRPDARRIILEAPAVLGWAKARAAEEKYALGQLQAGLEAAVSAGVLESDSPGLLAQLLFALFHEAGMSVAAAENPARAKAEVGLELDRVLNGLRPR
jgi:AcrR family transcriptional regulator